MIKNRSDDPDVAHAAKQALEIIEDTLAKLPPAKSFDYGGHMMKIGEYNVCEICTRPIAEAQQAHDALAKRAGNIEDPVINEHVELAADVFNIEAEAAIIRAELHNGKGSERIIDLLNGFLHGREIHDSYGHSHHGGQE